MGLLALLTNKEIFPTKWSLFIFVAYMSLFVSQGKTNQRVHLFSEVYLKFQFNGLKITLSSSRHFVTLS